MAKVPVMLIIHGLQRTEGEEYRTETRSAGHMTVQKDRIHISYNEEIEGVGAVPSLLTLSPDTITLVRKGQLATRMIYDAHAVTQAQYDTGAGRMAFAIRTSSLSLSEYSEDEAPQVVTAHVEYELIVAGDVISRNELAIRIEKAE